MATLKPVDEWPELLCGPMLRRVTQESVAVFVALKRACNVQLFVHESTSTGSGSEPSTPERFSSALTATRPLGKHLHVLVVQAEPTDTSKYLQPNHHYGYSLKFYIGGGGIAHVLGVPGFGSLTGERRLGYGDNQLPGFELPAMLEELNVFHGSCRKAHGEGPDMLALLDDLLQQYHDPGSTGPVEPIRPHQLILTGDQIYADDVSVCFLRLLMDTARELLAWREAERLGDPNVKFDHSSVRPGLKRGDFVIEHTAFSSDKVDGHLLYLGEFLTMYLMVWSDALWPEEPPDGTFTRVLPDVDEVLSENDDFIWNANYSCVDKKVRSFLKKVQRGGQDISMTDYEGARDEREPVQEMARTLLQVRRVLANVPTWMIFDDHEVTDDWFLNRDRTKRVRDSATGRQVIRNGLIAYTVFQDWGNNPEEYQAGRPKQQILWEAECGVAVDGAGYVAPPRLGDDLYTWLGLTEVRSEDNPDDVNEVAAGRISWHWDLRWKWGALDWRVVCLDTRTRRYFPKPVTDGLFVSDKANPFLLSPSAMSEQIGEPPADWDGTLAVVSPAPVVGLPGHELAQLAAGATYFGTELFDNEAWSGNPDGHEQVLRALAKFRRVILLSGDVHYGFSNDTAFFSGVGAAEAPARLVQLCSSPLRNEGGKPDYLEKAVDAAGFLPIVERLQSVGTLAFEAPPDGLLGALKQILLVSSEPDLYLRLGPAATGQTTLQLPDGPWADPAFGLLVLYEPQTNWRYRTRFLDNREREDTDYSALRGAIESEIRNMDSSADAAAWAGVILLRHRFIVAVNHIGALRFPPDEDEVEHRLYWFPRYKEHVLRIPMYTRYRVPLTPPAPGNKPEFFK